MRIPEQWLRAYCNPDWSTEQLADRLTMAGLEVEQCEAYAPPFTGIVVAQVVAVRPHPDADKLRLCEVDTGSETVEIVCGAPNVAAGIRVPCAVPGAVLPGGMQIKPVKMRGVLSQGMLCSARELGLSEDHSGLMLLPADTPLGENLRTALGLDEAVLTLKLTPNLAHCLSVFGVAREVSAISGSSLSAPAITPVAPAIADVLPVRIESPDLCGRFSGRVIRGVDPRRPTPAWIRDRLERAGQRSISALVDLSNYVMLELGRPSHVFDLDRIHGGLVVRWARDGESLKLLNGQTISLTPQFGVIVDEQAVESLAGIMGGDATAVDDETTNIYVEAAFWWPDAMVGRARKLNFSTDAAHRFERGVDAATTVEHLEYLTQLILSVCGGQAGPVDDQITAIPDPAPIRLRLDRTRKVIGAPLDDAAILAALARLQLVTRPLDAQSVEVSVPSHRFDLRIEEDLIEEVARLHGYDRLPVRPPMAPAVMRGGEEGRRRLIDVKRLVAAQDFQEVINYSFVDGQTDRLLTGIPAIRLLNPIAQTMDVMRTTLWGGMLGTLRSNLNRRATRVRLFESGRVFLADESRQGGALEVKGINQPMRLAMLAAGPAAPEQWGTPTRAVDFFDLKANLAVLLGPRLVHHEAALHPALHPGRSARLLLDDEALGWIGELHPAHQRALDLPGPVMLAEVDLAPLLQSEIAVFTPVSRFPPSIRDLAIVVDQTIPAAQIDGQLRSIAGSNPAAKCVRNIRLFDEYRGKGLENKEKSLAFRIWMQDTERTLEEAEVNAAVESLVAGLAHRFNARLR